MTRFFKLFCYEKGIIINDVVLSALDVCRAECPLNADTKNKTSFELKDNKVVSLAKIIIMCGEFLFWLQFFVRKCMVKIGTKNQTVPHRNRLFIGAIFTLTCFKKHFLQPFYCYLLIWWKVFYGLDCFEFDLCADKRPLYDL